MSRDYERGYSDGFEAGFKMAERFHNNKITEHKQVIAPDYKCIKCGKVFEANKVYNFVCAHPQCPSIMTCLTSTTMGAVGSSEYPTTPPGAVGAAGPV